MWIVSRIAVALVSGALLAGCGADDSTTGTTGQESGSEPSPTPSTSVPNGPIDFTQVALVSQSNVDASSSPDAVVLDSASDVNGFDRRYTGSQMGSALNKAYGRADVPDDEVLVGAVVDVSCQPPSEVEVEKTDQGVEVTAVAVKSKVEVQCIVPVTTVALVAVPEGVV